MKAVFSGGGPMRDGHLYPALSLIGYMKIKNIKTKCFSEELTSNHFYLRLSLIDIEGEK
jgi:hypothetical protein